MPVAYYFGSAQFDDAVRAAGRKAFSETLAAGLPGAPSGENFANTVAYPVVGQAVLACPTRPSECVTVIPNQGTKAAFPPSR